MADKITKMLRKLASTNSYWEVRRVIDLILSNDLTGLDIKKLKGHADLFRVRVGRYRIIFREIDEQNMIIDIDKRDDQTYREY